MTCLHEKGAYSEEADAACMDRNDDTLFFMDETAESAGGGEDGHLAGNGYG